MITFQSNSAPLLFYDFSIGANLFEELLGYGDHGPNHNSHVNTTPTLINFWISTYIYYKELARFARSFLLGFHTCSSCIYNIVLFRSTLHPILYASLSEIFILLTIGHFVAPLDHTRLLKIVAISAMVATRFLVCPVLSDRRVNMFVWLHFLSKQL